MKQFFSKTITIAFCGSQPRVGTTTQAFQILLYLKMRGYEVAYIDLSGSDYIEQLCKLYGGVEKVGNCVTYEEIPMYRTLDLEEDYQYLIKDYGTVKSSHFNEVSYFEQDVHVVCAGVKPNEIFEMGYILKKPEFNYAKFIFSFVPPDHRGGILKQMTNRAANTYFVGYNPDPFAFDATSNKIFRQILGAILSTEEIVQQKKSNVIKKSKKILRRVVKQLTGRIKTVSGFMTILFMYTVILIALLFKVGLLKV